MAAVPPVAPLTFLETVFRLTAGFEQCILLTDPQPLLVMQPRLTQLSIKQELMMFVSRQDALAEDLPPSVPICSVLGADEVGPLIAVETPLSRLILDLFRTHPPCPTAFCLRDSAPLPYTSRCRAVHGWSRPEMTCWSRVGVLPRSSAIVLVGLHESFTIRTCATLVPRKGPSPATTQATHPHRVPLLETPLDCHG